jgi:hypothetical protein
MEPQVALVCQLLGHGCLIARTTFLFNLERYRFSRTLATFFALYPNVAQPDSEYYRLFPIYWLFLSIFCHSLPNSALGFFSAWTHGIA